MHQQAAGQSLSAPKGGGEDSLLIEALPSHEHLHVLAEREGPVILAEAVEQLGILVIRVLVTHWRDTGQGCQCLRDTQGSCTAGALSGIKAVRASCSVLPCAPCPMEQSASQPLVPKNCLLMNA